jgi:ABC-type branched-subunit amino acid transport system substrate-binding protein
MKRDKKIYLFVVIYFILFTTIYLKNNFKSKHQKEIIDIGVISPSNQLVPRYEFVSRLAQENINRYCNQSKIDLRFNLITNNSAGDPEIALNITKKFHLDGINLIVGHGWNSHLNASHAYAMKNNMIIVTPSATSPEFAQSDTCFRLLPDDRREVNALTDAIINYGINTVIILQRDDSWGKKFSDLFLWDFIVKGGEIVDKISFIPDSITTINEAINRATMNVKEAVNHKGEDKVGILLLAHKEASDILLMAQESPILMNVTWFCSEINVLDENIRQNAGQVASKVSMIGPVNTHIYNEDYHVINKEFLGEFNEPLSFPLANVYDACWLLALSVIEAKSENPLEISEVFDAVAYNHYGITGPMSVNSNGDRSWIRYYFYGYYEMDGNIVYLRAGRYTRLEKNNVQGSSISHSPYEVVFDNFPYYVWDKEYESK